jgi:hypothetical protein
LGRPVAPACKERAARAPQALLTIFDAFMKDRRPMPTASPVRKRPSINPSVTIVAFSQMHELLARDTGLLQPAPLQPRNVPAFVFSEWCSTTCRLLLTSALVVAGPKRRSGRVAGRHPGLTDSRDRSPHCGEQGDGLPHSRAIACQLLDHPACSPVKRVRVTQRSIRRDARSGPQSDSCD